MGKGSTSLVRKGKKLIKKGDYKTMITISQDETYETEKNIDEYAQLCADLPLPEQFCTRCANTLTRNGCCIDCGFWAGSANEHFINIFESRLVALKP